MNVTEALFASRGDATRPVIVDGDREYSYGELYASIGQLVDLIDVGPTTVGDRIGIVARNSFFWIAAYFATVASGRIAVPFPTTTAAPPAEARSQADFVGVSAFFVERAQSRRFAAVVGDTAVIDETVLTDGAFSPEPTWSSVDVSDDADAVLQLTSGTTSAPKAVRVTHGNIRANTDSIVEYLDLQADDRMLVVLPLSYCFGASLLQTHLRVGGSVALCHTLTFPETVIEAIDRFGCTGFAGVPSTYQLLLRASSLPTRRLPSLRHLQQAGGRLAAPLVDELVAAQPHARVFVMYGQTEATSRLSYLPPDEIESRRGSIGRGIPRVTLRVVDEHGDDVAPGDVGEVLASGDNITKGYWNAPEATAERFGHGVLRTGDLATVDEDGYLYIVDRQADFIKSWGVRISSQEIEEAASRIPNVVSAAAVGVPDDVAGEAIVLFVVPGDDSLTVDDVHAELRTSLAKHMVPNSIRFVTELPMNANGKLRKSKLRELATSEDLAESK